MIKILAGGKRHSGWLAEGVFEYEKRLKKPFKVEWRFVAEEKIEKEVLALDKREFVILLDENGVNLISSEFSEVLSGNMEQKITIVIGGAFGHFSNEILERANLKLSLSSFVLPHQLCRLLLTEQIYRAQEIRLGRPYHHA